MSLVAAAGAGSSSTASAWVHALAANDPSRRAGRRWLCVLLFGWFVVTLLAVPMGIGSSWRECDTQAIARNFVSEGFNPLRPRIDWRGDTDGGVECEFPLYQLMIASVIGLLGEAEWPGRLISLLAMVMATVSLHRLLEARCGPSGALAGAIVFLAGGHAFLLGSRVTPDASSTAFALAGLVAFVQFLGTGQGGTLALATAMTTVACLTKPTALQVGLLQFAWTVCVAPRRLRELRVWLAWAVVLVVVAAWLVRGMQLYAETGLTFGVAAGGETKFPTLRSLREKWIWIWLLVTTLRYGISAFGFVGIVMLCGRRLLDRVDLALLGVVGLGLVGTLRYSHHFGVGPQYHVFAAVAGAWFAARAWSELARRQPFGWIDAALLVIAGLGLFVDLGVDDHLGIGPRFHVFTLVAGAFLLARRWASASLLPVGLLLLAAIAVGAQHLHEERSFRVNSLHPSAIAVGAAVEALSAPDELVVVHGNREAMDAFWRRRTNFEEPMLLYLSRRRGWVLPRDGFTAEAIDGLHRRGARIVVDQFPADTPADARGWLERHSESVKEIDGRRIHRLRAPS